MATQIATYAASLLHALLCAVPTGQSCHPALPRLQIALIADEAGGMTRMLGLDIPAKTGDKSAAGPRSQRWDESEHMRSSMLHAPRSVMNNRVPPATGMQRSSMVASSSNW
jgi:hypothetical protein